MKTWIGILGLAALWLAGCATHDTPKPRAAGLEQLRETWLDRNGSIGSNVVIRVRRYSVETSTASIRFYLDETNLRNPCNGTAEYQLPIERLMASEVTPVLCPPDQHVWELVIDVSR